MCRNLIEAVEYFITFVVLRVINLKCELEGFGVGVETNDTFLKRLFHLQTHSRFGLVEEQLISPVIMRMIVQIKNRSRLIKSQETHVRKYYLFRETNKIRKCFHSLLVLHMPSMQGL